ncbi:hypothetical protein Droror1_Dr00002573 [Drosera rotundifolia]
MIYVTHLEILTKSNPRRHFFRRLTLPSESENPNPAAVAAAALADASIEDPLAANYGDIRFNDLQSKEITGREWTDVRNQNEELKDCVVLVRGWVHVIRAVSKKMVFVVLRDQCCTVQCAVSVGGDRVSREMVRFVSGLSRESVVDVEGVVTAVDGTIRGASQKVEIVVHKIYCISRALPTLPFNIEDASRSEEKIKEKLQVGVQYARVNQDTRLNNRVLDLKTDAKHAIFRLKSQIKNVMDIVDRLFVAIFDGLKESCSKEGETIGSQYPFTTPEYLRKTLRLTFKEGVEMLKEAGIEVDPLSDLNTESERKLGELVREKYATDFYILHRYPLAVRPFYTMPCYDDPAYSNSFDAFIRGEEIISGAQRIHDPEFLKQRAESCGIDVKTISTYIDSFRYGAPLHGGFGAGLEQVIMLYCGLGNIRMASLFPRDPLRLEP